MTFAPRTPVSQADFESSGGRLVTADGRALPLIGATLKTDARGGLARIVLEQTFRNPHDEPLRVTYTLPLPADGAVSGFAFRIGEERVVGRVEPKARARELFEDAVLRGHTAALLDQQRSSLFTQEVGNVPPRTQVVCEVQVDQRLTWLADGAWEWRFPTVVAPRYLGAHGRVADAANVTVDVADGELPVKLSLTMSIRDRLSDGARPESPSHPLHSESLLGRFEVAFGDERGVRLDRDVVVRWRVAAPQVGTSLDVTGSGHALLTLVPPSVKKTPVPRDLIVLLDTSGSMGGAPLDQARRVTAALVDSLNDADQLELIEFSNTARRWKRGAVNATSANRRDAQGWLARLTASGGTEMRTGILEALAPLRAESQRQVVLITDGQIGFEHEILSTIMERLPRGCRVHTVGVGSGVNRSLLKPAAQAGRGVEQIIGLGEDVEPFVKRLLSRTNEPLLTDVEISGSAVLQVAPTRLPDLFGGAPALISLALKPEGGEVIVRARSAEGDVEERVQVANATQGEASAAVRALFAREVAEELELERACSNTPAAIDARLEKLGTEFQISTRMTSWVAVSTSAMVDPRAPKRTETMPHELAYGLSAEGVGLRHANAPMASGGAPMMRARSMAQGAPAPAGQALAGKDFARAEKASLKREAATGSFAAAPPPAEESATFDDAADYEAAKPAPEMRRMSAKDAPQQADKGIAPPAPKAPAPAKAEGFFGAVKRKLSELGGGGPNKRRVKATARRVGTKLVVTFVAMEDFAWTPPFGVTVNFDAGNTTATVDATLTTQAGHIARGLTVTLVLELADDGRAVRSVEFMSAGELLELELH